jgi:deazaflavin-dependent oxidoreductase (nitroreductase family)
LAVQSLCKEGATVWDRETFELAMREKEVDLTTWGRKSGRPSRKELWIWGEGGRLYIRSGQGMGRDWPQNLLARGKGIIHIAGRDIPVNARHVTDMAEARKCSGMVVAKYPQSKQPGPDDAPTPGESATFELTPGEAR